MFCDAIGISISYVYNMSLENEPDKSSLLSKPSLSGIVSVELSSMSSPMVICSSWFISE